jgi:glycosyltransferase involved in cell wall biosynthesis
MSKTIGMLLDGFYPSDIRVQKEAVALIEAGSKVALLCKRRKGEAYQEVFEGIEVMRINAGVSHTAKGIFDIVVSLNFIHPVFKRNLTEFIKRHSVDVLHVHDLPLVKTAVIGAKKNNLPVVADFHENYPEALKVWFQWKKNPLIRLKNKVFFGYKRWSAYEKWAVHKADFVIAVVEEMKTRLVAEHQIVDDKIVVITNTESKDFINSKLDESIYAEDKANFIVAYTGGVGPHRGVDTAIEAFSFLEEYEDIVLYITGTSSKAALKAMNLAIEKGNLKEKVKILGYRPFTEFYSFMKMARVNLIPHHSNGHTDNTVPHKLFQCMMVGKPLLVSSSTPLKRIVSNTSAGLVFEAGNARDLADKIIELYKDKSKCEELGENGRAASIRSDYNWEDTSKVLVNFYSKIA